MLKKHWDFRASGGSNPVGDSFSGGVVCGFSDGVLTAMADF